MTGSGGASSIPNCQWSLSDFSEYWIARSSRAMTSGGRFAPIGIRSTNRFVVTGALLVIVSLAGGCSAIDRITQIGEQPKLAAIENPTSQPGYKPVQMPMPKPELASYNANSLWRNGSRAFFKDQRAARVGDILTITVNFTDKANLSNETKRDRTSKEDSGVSDFIGAQTITQAHKILPGKLLTTDSTSKYDGSGSVDRKENLQTNVAAVVTQVLPNGNLVGRRQAGDQGQFRNPRDDRRRHRAPRGHPERQHHRFLEDRAGPHRLWRPRPDHRLPAAALRPAGDRHPAAVLGREFRTRNALAQSSTGTEKMMLK
jgi:flagellar L-ring protein precursor FlgH